MLLSPCVTRCGCLAHRCKAAGMPNRSIFNVLSFSSLTVMQRMRRKTRIMLCWNT